MNKGFLNFNMSFRNVSKRTLLFSNYHSFDTQEFKQVVKEFKQVVSNVPATYFNTSLEKILDFRSVKAVVEVYYYEEMAIVVATFNKEKD